MEILKLAFKTMASIQRFICVCALYIHKGYFVAEKQIWTVSLMLSGIQTKDIPKQINI